MTPRDALAAALVGCRVTTGTYTAAEGSADRILSTLAAEGWVLVRRTFVTTTGGVAIQPAPNPAPRIVAVHQCGDCGYTGDLAALTAHRCAPDPAPLARLEQP